MTIQIQTRTEGARGCGYRKPGAMYLIGPPLSSPCCKLPLELSVCPCCGAGIRPARGWTWVDADQLLGILDDGDNHLSGCLQPPEMKMFNPCPLASHIGRAGLLWIGEQFYKTPTEFLAEAREVGISRLIHTVPRDFKLGETWVLLAHRKGSPYEEEVSEGLLAGTRAMQTRWRPAIFSVFRPTAIEYIVRGDETEDELEGIVKRGLTPINVNPRRAYR